MLKREEWLHLARKLDWNYSYVSEKEVFPEEVSGRPWLPHAEWQAWDEPYRTSYTEYVTNQHAKEAAVRAVHDAVGKVEDFQKLDRGWLSAVKLHAATLPLAAFAAGGRDTRAAALSGTRPARSAESVWWVAGHRSTPTQALGV